MDHITTSASPTSEPPRSEPPTVVHVCTTCRVEGETSVSPTDRAGSRLWAALRAATADNADIVLVPVECLSVCKRPCTVSFAAPGKWTYIYGDLPPDSAAPVILEALRLYAQTPDGLIPWKLRSDAIKKGVVARLPPDPAVPRKAAS